MKNYKDCDHTLQNSTKKYVNAEYALENNSKNIIMTCFKLTINKLALNQTNSF